MSRARTKAETKATQSDSREQTAKPVVVKADGTLAFALTAGAVGLGLSLLEQEMAVAAEKAAADVNHDIHDADVSGNAGSTVNPSMLAGRAGPEDQTTHVSVAAANPGHVAVDLGGAHIAAPDLTQPSEAQVPSAATSTTNGAPAHPEDQLAQAAAISPAADQSPADQAPAAESVGSGDTLHIGNDIAAGEVGFGPAIPITTGPLTSVDSVIGDLLEADSGLVAGVVETVDGSLETVGDLVEGLLGGDGSGLVPELVETVSDTVGVLGDTVGGLLGGLLGDGDSGPVPELTETLVTTVEVVGDSVGDAVGAVGDLAGALLGGGSLGAASDLTETVSDTVETTVDVVTGVVGTALGAVGGLLGGSDPDAPSDLAGSSASQPESTELPQLDLFGATFDALQLTDALSGSLAPVLGFLGLPNFEVADHPELANSHGSLFHGLI